MKGSRKTISFFAGIFFAIIIFPMSSAEGAPKLSRVERAELAQKVKGILKNKCAKCHTVDGSERKEYKDRVDIDFIMDLEKIATYPEILVRGDASESMLYMQVDSDTMPLEEVDEKPLPEEEKNAIKKWIDAGAPNEKGMVSTLVR